MLTAAAAAVQGPPTPTPASAAGGLSPARVLACQGPSVASRPASTWGAGRLNKFTFLEWTPEVEGTTPKPAYTSKVRLPRPTRTWWSFSLKPVPVLQLHLLHRPRPSVLLSGGAEPGSSSPPPLRARAPCGPRGFLRACTPARSWPSRRQPEPHWTASRRLCPHLPTCSECTSKCARPPLPEPGPCPAPSASWPFRPPWARRPGPGEPEGRAGSFLPWGPVSTSLCPESPQEAAAAAVPLLLPLRPECRPGCWGAGPACCERAGLQGSAGSGLRFRSWLWCSPPR